MLGGDGWEDKLIETSSNCLPVPRQLVPPIENAFPGGLWGLCSLLQLPQVQEKGEGQFHVLRQLILHSSVYHPTPQFAGRHIEVWKSSKAELPSHTLQIQSQFVRSSILSSMLGLESTAHMVLGSLFRSAVVAWPSICPLIEPCPLS